MDIVNQCAADLQPLTEQCRECEHMPEHILRMRSPQIHVALLACGKGERNTYNKRSYLCRSFKCIPLLCKPRSSSTVTP